MLLLLYIWAPRDTVILNHSLLMKSKMNKKCLLLTLQTLVPALFMMSKTQISSLVHEVKDTDVQTQNGCAHSCIFVIFMSVFVKPEHKSTEKLLQVFFFKKKKFLFHSYQEGLWMWQFFTWDPLYEVWSQTFSLRGTSTSKVFEVHSVQHHTQHDLVSHSIRILTKIHISTVWQ